MQAKCSMAYMQVAWRTCMCRPSACTLASLKVLFVCCDCQSQQTVTDWLRLNRLVLAIAPRSTLKAILCCVMSIGMQHQGTGYTATRHTSRPPQAAARAARHLPPGGQWTGRPAALQRRALGTAAA